MISLLAERLAEAYRSPRKSARRMLAAQPSATESLLMAALGFALLAFFSRLMEFALGVTMIEAMAPFSDRSEEDIAKAVSASKSPGLLVNSFALHMAEAALAAVLSWRLGVAAGGVASFKQMLAMTCWWSLATAPVLGVAQLILLISAPGAVAFGMLVMFAAALYIFYLFAAFLAEAHGFESEGIVFISVLGVTFAMSIMLVAFFGVGAGGA